MVIKCLYTPLEQPERLNTAVILALVSLGLFTSCQHANPKSGAKTPPPVLSGLVDDGLVIQLAQVDSVAGRLSPLDVTKAEITISGLLHDGATQVQDIQQQKLADGFVITVTTVRSKNATASLALIPFDRTINVSIADMPKGWCKIMVNGVAATFMIP
ncbi:hypothetical protein BH11VER1_BH11VER1_19000 [soil metagenome]